MLSAPSYKLLRSHRIVSPVGDIYRMDVYNNGFGEERAVWLEKKGWLSSAVESDTAFGSPEDLGCVLQSYGKTARDVEVNPSSFSDWEWSGVKDKAKEAGKSARSLSELWGRAREISQGTNASFAGRVAVSVAAFLLALPSYASASEGTFKTRTRLFALSPPSIETNFRYDNEKVKVGYNCALAEGQNPVTVVALNYKTGKFNIVFHGTDSVKDSLEIKGIATVGNFGLSAGISSDDVVQAGVVYRTLKNIGGDVYFEDNKGNTVSGGQFWRHFIDAEVFLGAGIDNNHARIFLARPVESGFNIRGSVERNFATGAETYEIMAVIDPPEGEYTLDFAETFFGFWRGKYFGLASIDSPQSPLMYYLKQPPLGWRTRKGGFSLRFVDDEKDAFQAEGVVNLTEKQWIGFGCEISQTSRRGRVNFGSRSKKMNVDIGVGYDFETEEPFATANIRTVVTY